MGTRARLRLAVLELDSRPQGRALYSIDKSNIIFLSLERSEYRIDIINCQNVTHASKQLFSLTQLILFYKPAVEHIKLL